MPRKGVVPPALKAYQLKKGTGKAKKLGNKKNKGGMPASVKAKLAKKK